MQVLAGMIPQSSGQLTYKNSTGNIAADDIYQKITYAAPYMDLIEEFTLQEQVEFHFKTRRSRLKRTVDEMIQMMYLEKASDKHIGNFSSGMKQRVKLALAFNTETEIIFLDEPGSNLDKNAFQWYQDQLMQVPKETLIFIASNNPDEYPDQAKNINIAAYK